MPTGNDSLGWMAIGFFGQILFSARFAVQLYSSEKAGKSVMPMSFWYWSLAGTSLLLAYALHRRDPVFTVGQLFGAYVYVRNLVLLSRTEPAAEPGAGAT